MHLSQALVAMGWGKQQAAAFLALLVETACMPPEDDPAFNNGQEALTWLRKLTQKNWLRRPGSERWEISDGSSLQAKRQDFLELLRVLALVGEIRPTERYYDHVMILSAVQRNFEERVAFFRGLWDAGLRAKTVYLVGGSRLLVPGLEDRAIASLGAEATELEMLLHTFEHTFAGCQDSVEVVAVDTPIQRMADGSLRRPNTEDTIYSWLGLAPSPGSVLVVTNQPYIHYQDAIVRNVLPSAFTVTSVGPVSKPEEKIATMLDAIARRLYADFSVLERKLTEGQGGGL